MGQRTIQPTDIVMHRANIAAKNILRNPSSILSKVSDSKQSRLHLIEYIGFGVHQLNLYMKEWILSDLFLAATLTT